MTMCFEVGTKPGNLEAKTWGIGDIHELSTVFLCGQNVSWDLPFALLLSEVDKIIKEIKDSNDPRFALVKMLKTVKIVEGYSSTSFHFNLDVNSVMSLKDRQDLRQEFGIINFSFYDFCILVYYVITNTDIFDTDPRSIFLEKFLNKNS